MESYEIKSYEYKYFDICSLQNTLKLKQLLDVIFRRDGGGVADWTYTVARRRPDNEQGDLSKYIRPLCSEVKES